MKLVIASNNAHKLVEIREILLATGRTDIELVSISAWPELPEPPEDQDTFQGNALQKARFVYTRLGLPVVADDSGIEVDALGGRPGVHSKRFTAQASPAANNARMLAELADQPDRRARFRCALALVTARGEATAEGTCEGRIAHQAQGNGGFGYDPIFLPQGQADRSMAQLSAAEKNAISHRGRAFRQLPALLARLSDPDQAGAQ
ncbi:MAG: RdgB/HAM1 family non-canonical purine NTP pyrophosphatase [Oligoflexia bacterium]|nr:RdgB/HAM1 family non-canonical purine NTP pyrophosphatase [Oligoflexia bacterium]